MGNKVKVRDIRYGTDGKSITWGTALVYFGEGRTEMEIGKVRAVVKLHPGDVFDERTGRKLVYNILRRKGISKVHSQLISARRTRIFELAELNSYIKDCDDAEASLKAEFEKISFPN